MSTELPVSFGRQAFGADPDAYERARPAYPEAIYAILKERCGLRPGIAVFEIGPGPGMVTQRLADEGVASITCVEPDPRLATHLRRRISAKTKLTVIEAVLEEAELPEGAFDLGVAATSFHWVEQRKGIAKAAEALRPGGWWACWWNLYGQMAPDAPFSRAIAPLFKGVPRRHNAPGRGDPFESDIEARLADLKADGRFEALSAERFHWSVTQSADQVRDLFATFSPIVALDEDARRRFLDGLHAVVRDEFGGSVDYPSSAVLYTARRSQD